MAPSLYQKWYVLTKEIGDATKLEFPRRYFTFDVCVDGNDTEQHVFADRKRVRGNQSSLALAKPRVEPTKKQFTLPELELAASLTAGRLASYLQAEQLQVTRATLWSDSWKYCPTTENPTDLLIRRITGDQPKASSLWKHGRTWLSNILQSPSWPTTEVLRMLTTETSTDEFSTNSTVPAQQQGPHHVINSSDFSSLPRLSRITAYVFRFFQRLQQPTRSYNTLEYDRAMTKWAKKRQFVVFHAVHAEVDNLFSKLRNRTSFYFSFAYSLTTVAFYAVAEGYTTPP